jgi:hypothetical protein
VIGWEKVPLVSQVVVPAMAAESRFMLRVTLLDAGNAR